MANLTFGTNLSVPYVAESDYRRHPTLSLAAMVGQVFTWSDRIRQRHRLRQLDAHLLRDIGLTRAQAEDEAHKPFWVA